MRRNTIAIFALTIGAALPSVTARAQGRGEEAPFKWSGDVAKDHWVYVRNLNGPVRVEAASGSKVKVTATKRWRRGDPQEVEISVKQVGSGNGDLLVCAIWRDTNTRCDEDGYSSRGHNDGWGRRNNDTQVEFTIHVPAGVRIDATTVNGDMDVEGATSEVIARTVNGSVEARSSGGPVRANTTNGDVTVRMGTLPDHGNAEYRTVNGSITVEIPANSSADLDMSTVNGHVQSDFPLTIEGTFSTKRVRATLGKGGTSIRLSTVNGSIHLRKA